MRVLEDAVHLVAFGRGRVGVAWVGGLAGGEAVRVGFAAAAGFGGGCGGVLGGWLGFGFGFGFGGGFAGFAGRRFALVLAVW